MTLRETEQRKVIEIIYPLLEKYGSRYDKAADFVFRMKTTKGLPHEIVFDKLEHEAGFSKDALLLTLHQYQFLDMEHKLISGIGEERIKGLQDSNNREIIRLNKWGNLL